MGKIKIKKDDKVIVIAGEHKGAEGKVFKVLRDKNKVLVDDRWGARLLLLLLTYLLTYY